MLHSTADKEAQTEVQISRYLEGTHYCSVGGKKKYIKSQRGTISVVNERDVSRQDLFEYHIFLKCSPVYLCPVLPAEQSNPASIFFFTQNAISLSA